MKLALNCQSAGRFPVSWLMASTLWTLVCGVVEAIVISGEHSKAESLLGISQDSSRSCFHPLPSEDHMPMLNVWSFLLLE